MKFFTWDTVETEAMSDVISRKVISGEKAMVAQVFLKKDAVVPEHHHESEQITYILEGALKFELEGKEVVVRKGEVLHIPSNVPHRAVALEDIYQRFSVLADRKHMAAGTLSGGERQMLVIARALLSAPRVLLLDEPSLGLAPKTVAGVMELIRRLRDENGLTIMLVEQNARSALAIADQGIVLNLGKVVARDEAAVLAADEGLRRHYLGF